MSFADQWEFFSSIKKLDELLVETIAAKIEKTISNYIEEKIENDEGNKVKKSIEKGRTPLVLSAEIERNLISQRTKEALERKKAEGQKLGRPKGSTSDFSKLDGAELGTTIMLMQGISVNRMAKLYGVHRNTVKKFIAAKRLGALENIKRTLELIG